MIKRPSRLAFKDDFSTVSAFDWPAKWGGRSASQEYDAVTSEPVMRFRLSSGEQDYLIRRARTFTNGRVMVKAKALGQVLRTLEVAVRIGGTTTNRRSYVARIGTNNNLLILRMGGTGTAPTQTQLASVPYEHNSLVWSWIDFMADGPNFYLTAWRAGDPRPEGWMVTATDATFSTGELGFRSVNTQDHHVALFSTTAME